MGYMRGGTILRIDLESGRIVKDATTDYAKAWPTSLVVGKNSVY